MGRGLYQFHTAYIQDRHAGSVVQENVNLYCQLITLEGRHKFLHDEEVDMGNYSLRNVKLCTLSKKWYNINSNSINNLNMTISQNPNRLLLGYKLNTKLNSRLLFFKKKKTARAEIIRLKYQKPVLLDLDIYSPFF